MAGSAIEEVITELLWSYRQLYLPGVEGERTTDEEYIKYAKESEQAWSSLQAAFTHKRGFGQAMLRDMSEGALERLTRQLVAWSRDIQWPDQAGDGLWRSEANTAEECVEKTGLFMQDQYWPFTKIIRVYLSSQVLKTGVVLADLPGKGNNAPVFGKTFGHWLGSDVVSGLQDTNLARVRATHDYLLKCHHIFIVADISRAITDQSLKSSLFSVISRHVPLEWEKSAAESLKIAVVCTKTEVPTLYYHCLISKDGADLGCAFKVINLQAARREFCGPGKLIRADIINDLDAQIEDAKASGNTTAKKALKQRCD